MVAIGGDEDLRQQAFNPDRFGADEFPRIRDYVVEKAPEAVKLAEELAADKNGQIRIAKVNIDDNPMTPTKYGVRGIPTLMLFKNGEISATKVGAAPKGKLYEWVEEAL